MGWRDRDYARDATSGFGTNPLMWLLRGRVHVFTVWGVRVSAHASLIVFATFILLLGGWVGPTFLDRLAFIAVLFGIILLHEFGHIAGGRMTGGQADEVELTPLGGLALVQPAKGWYAHTVTIVCGPLVNVLICLACAGLLGALYGGAPLGLFSFGSFESSFEAATSTPGRWLLYVYSISYFLLLFNMLPVWPLDGGQLLQGLLWWRIGWYRATMITTLVALIGGGIMVVYGLFLFRGGGGLMFAFIGGTCAWNSFQLRKQLQAASEFDFGDRDEPDYMKSVFMDPDEPEKVGVAERVRRRRADARQQKAAAAAMRLEQEVDAVLEKISKSGMGSLTHAERKTLERAREAKMAR